MFVRVGISLCTSCFAYCGRCYVVLVWVCLHVVGCVVGVFMITNYHISHIHCQRVRATGHHRDLQFS